MKRLAKLSSGENCVKVSISVHTAGALYVSSAGGSSVHRFSSSLRPEAQYTAQCDEDRRTDCTACPSNLADPVTTADHLNATSVVRLDSTSGQLLVCGGRCGHCAVLNTSDPDPRLRALDRTSSAGHVASRVAGARAVMVFSAVNSTAADVTLPASRLFVAGATADDAEAVSVRERSPPTASAGFDAVGRRSFASDALADSYRFSAALDAGDGFVYFVALRRRQRAPVREVRLVRLCRDDVGRLDSYAELTLTCVLQTARTAALDVPVTAHVAPVGARLARRFQLEAGEPAIYLVAEAHEPPAASDDDDDDRWTSGICVYTMQQVTYIH